MRSRVAGSKPIRALQKESPLYDEVDIRDFYPKYRISTRVVGLPGPMVARDDINKNVVYQMLRNCLRQYERAANDERRITSDSAATGLRGLSIPLYARSAKFFKEQGS